MLSKPHRAEISKTIRTHFLLIFLLFLIVQCTPRKPLTGKVIRIADGDTFTLLTQDKKQIRVRLHGIDAPEKKQDFSSASKEYLSNLVYGKNVTVVQKDIDRYGRIIGVVKIHDTVVNEELLKAGLAWHYKQHDQNREWATFEIEAKHQKKGIWSIPNPTAPWEYRKEKTTKRKR